MGSNFQFGGKLVYKLEFHYDLDITQCLAGACRGAMRNKWVGEDFPTSFIELLNTYRWRSCAASFPNCLQRQTHNHIQNYGSKSSLNISKRWTRMRFQLRLLWISECTWNMTKLIILQGIGTRKLYTNTEEWKLTLIPRK